MLDHFKWRKKQISHYFLPKTRQERLQLKQQYASQFAKKEIAAKSTDLTLKELKETVLATAVSNPYEDPTKTNQLLYKTSNENEDEDEEAVADRANAPVVMQEQARKLLLTEEEAGSKVVSNAFFREHQSKKEELRAADVKEPKDMTVRQLLKIDDRMDPVQLRDSVYQSNVQEEPEMQDGQDEAERQENLRALHKHTTYRKN
jgi:hypothetical protein